jgi:peroxiredoxin
MRAMPEMKKVADDFRGKPVVILGLNTDSDRKDAQFVADALQLNYTTLQIPREVAYDQFNVHGFPSMLLVDGNGIVRDYEIGYSPDMRQKLDKSIGGLLGR